METKELNRLLRELHAELGRAGTLDAESRSLLRDIARDVESVTAEKTEGPVDHQNALEGMAVRFESDHPALAGVLRQLVDALAKAGI